MESHTHHTNIKAKTQNATVTFTEALEQAKYGKFNYFVIIVTGVALGSVLLETSSVAFYMPVAECDLNLSNSRKGLLSAVSYIGIIVSSHLWGFLADTKGRKRVIKPTLIVAFVVTLISSFATNFWSMLTLRFINGIFISGASATMYAYVSEFHTDHTRSRAMMISSFLFSVCALLMPIISYAVINREWRFYIPLFELEYKPWRLFLVVCGIPGFLCGIAMCFLPESPKFLLSIKRETEAKEVLEQMYRMNGGKDQLKLPKILPEEESIISERLEGKSKNLYGFRNRMWDQTAPLFGRKFLRSTLIVCFTQFWLFFVSNGMYMWFPYVINAMGEFMSNHPDENELLCPIVYDKHEILQLSESNSSLDKCPEKLENSTYMYSLILEILYCSTFAVVSVIINRIGKITLMFIIIIFCSSCGILSVLLPYTSIAAVLYVIIFLTGAGINVLSAVTVDLFPTQLRAMAMCVSLMMGRIGSVAGTNYVGALLSDNCELSIYVPCSIMMSCAILMLFLPRSTVLKNTSSA